MKVIIKQMMLARQTGEYIHHGMMFWGILLSLISMSGAMHDTPGANPIGPPTIPQSSFQQSQFQSPDPFDISNNLMMTGNVGGGKHFRGSMPYGSTSDLMIPVGSSYLDGFLRYTQPSIRSGVNILGYSPFYSHTAGVVHMSPGQGYVTIPTVPTIGSGPVLKQISMPKQSLMENNRVAFLGDISETVNLHVLRATEQNHAVDMHDMIPFTDNRQYFGLDKEDQVDKPLLKSHQGNEDEKESSKSIHIESLDTHRQGIHQAGSLDPSGIWIPQDMNEMHDQLILPQIDPDDEKTKIHDINEGNIKISMQGERSSKEVSKIDPVYNHAYLEYNATIQYSKYIYVAEDALRVGRLEKALDSFRLAQIYRPEDPVASLGKCLVLFALGEYTGSVLYLNRALEKAYGKYPLGVSDLFGGDIYFTEYIKQAESQLATTPSPDLYIILGYIYYQIGDLDSARGAFAVVGQARPDDPAVKIMKAIIEQAYQSR